MVLALMNINQEINTTRENCSFYTEIYLIKHTILDTKMSKSGITRELECVGYH